MSFIEKLNAKKQKYFCARHKVKKPQTHRAEARQAFIGLIKKKRKGKKLIDKTKLIQIRCLQADFQLLL
ncbi:hypothetical protein [Hallella colorans]|uniref:hypothetical protein n=1 Tax=Hallella colorans TaxID=1703337 RepID=UPI0023F3C631|nr:hypothetical protein [Hallella colorans]